MKRRLRGVLMGLALALGLAISLLPAQSRTVSAGTLLTSGQLWTYSATTASGTPITVYNLSNDTQMAQFDPRGENGRGIAFDPRDGNIWDTVVTNFLGDGLIHKNPPLGGADILTIPDPGGPGGPGIGALDFDPEESVLWASAYNPDAAGNIKFYKLDPTTGAVLQTCTYPKHGPGVGNDTMAIARPADLGGKKVILTDGGETSPLPLAAIDVASCAVVKTYTLPLLTAAADKTSGVSGIAVDPATGDLIGANPYNSLVYNFGPAPYASVVSKVASISSVEDISLGDLLIKAAGTSFGAVEGAPFSGQVATLTDPDPLAVAADYSATISWGDGSSSSAAISGPTGGPFSVKGTHTYSEEGTYTVTVKITDSDTSFNSAIATSTATVGDAALAATCRSATLPVSFTGLAVANLADANPSGVASDFSAVIDWGDASSSAGTVTGPTGGPFVVSGSHTYATTGTFTVTITVMDDGGSTASASCRVLVFATVAGGTFVIGDGNAALGTGVTFWGAQWAKLNTLSGGSAPSAFKGFENTPASVTCGINWSTATGNSPPPPPGPLPAFMAVIVSSSISKSGSTISGNTVHIVIVKTNPGYQPDPGHPGSGTVVAQIC
jgi:hypothetical protein